jgi:2-phospho-L-lactate guanylyltransferase (CobY/MobA/RfbA family)
MAKLKIETLTQAQIEDSYNDVALNFEGLALKIASVTIATETWQIEKKTIENKFQAEIRSLKKTIENQEKTIDLHENRIAKLKNDIVEIRQKTIIELIDSENDKKFIKFVEKKQSQTENNTEFKQRIDQIIEEIDKCIVKLQQQ